MRTLIHNPKIAGVYGKDQYWNAVNGMKTATSPTLPEWAFNFISIHADSFGLGWSLCSPMKFVEHPSCKRPQWEHWHFETRDDAVSAACWLAKAGQVHVVVCD